MAFLPLPEGNNAAETIRRLRAIDAEFYGRIVATAGTLDSITVTNATITSGTLGTLDITGDLTLSGGTIKTDTDGNHRAELTGTWLAFYDDTDTLRSYLRSNPTSDYFEIVGGSASLRFDGGYVEASDIWMPASTGQIWFEADTSETVTDNAHIGLHYSGATGNVWGFYSHDSVSQSGMGMEFGFDRWRIIDDNAFGVGVSLLEVYPTGALEVLGDIRTNNDQLFFNYDTETNSYMQHSTSGYFRWVDAGVEILRASTARLSGDAVEWDTWTPTVTNVTKGNGTETARYIRIGDTVIARYKFELGTTSAVTGDVAVTLPVNVAGTMVDTAVGYGLAHQSGVSNSPCFMQYVNTSTVRFRVHNSSGTYVTVSAFSSTVPFTWGSNDVLSFTVIYEAA